MAEESKEKPSQPDAKPKTPSTPLVFISHDARDGELAEAFSKLLRSVTAGMLKSFRSSDKKGTEGIEFGDEWYKRLMKKLESASDVVCLLETNIDDATGELIGHLMTELFGEGALDVFTEPIEMKQNRPAVKLSVICEIKDIERTEQNW